MPHCPRSFCSCLTERDIIVSAAVVLPDCRPLGIKGGDIVVIVVVVTAAAFVGAVVVPVASLRCYCC